MEQFFANKCMKDYVLFLFNTIHSSRSIKIINNLYERLNQSLPDYLVFVSSFR